MVVRPDGAGRSRRRPLVGGVGIGVDEDDGEGGGAGLDQALGGSRHLGRIDGLSHRAIGQRALGHLDAQVAVGDGGEVAPQAPGVGAVAAAHFQHVAEAGRGDDADARALALQQRIGADRGAMDDGAERGERPEGLQALEEADGLVAAVRGDLGGAERARRLVEKEQVGEGATDIDANERGHALAPVT